MKFVALLLSLTGCALLDQLMPEKEEADTDEEDPQQEQEEQDEEEIEEEEEWVDTSEEEEQEEEEEPTGPALFGAYGYVNDEVFDFECFEDEGVYDVFGYYDPNHAGDSIFSIRSCYGDGEESYVIVQFLIEVQEGPIEEGYYAEQEGLITVTTLTNNGSTLEGLTEIYLDDFTGSSASGSFYGSHFTEDEELEVAGWFEDVQF